MSEKRLILDVRWGPMNGRKVAIDAGSSLRVGRTEWSDLILAHDRHLSRKHFSIVWDGKRGSVRDEDTIEGTFLNGERVTSGEIGHGTWIRAGETDFTVHVEDHVPAHNEDEDDDADDDDELTEDERWVVEQKRAEETKRVEAARIALAKLREESAKEPLYAILDAARDDRILELLRQSVEPHQSLYEGVQGEPLATVAPYLTGPFRGDSVLLDRLVMEGWGKRWGIYLTSREKFVEVRRHFRRFLTVEFEETGEQVYFRFYDPGVLGALSKAWTTRQRADVCNSGQIKSMFAEEVDTASVIRLESVSC